jgi:hypothetical protein
MPKEKAKEVKSSKIKKVNISKRICQKEQKKVSRFTFGFDFIGLRYSRKQARR